MGDIFEDLAERVATARTRALMGERKEALAILQRAKMDYQRFREVLETYPGGLALHQSLESAQETLRAERVKEKSGADKSAASKATSDSSRAA